MLQDSSLYALLKWGLSSTTANNLTPRYFGGGRHALNQGEGSLGFEIRTSRQQTVMTGMVANAKEKIYHVLDSSFSSNNG